MLEPDGRADEGAGDRLGGRAIPRRPAAHDGVGDQHFTFSIQRAGGLIKQQDGRVGEEGAGDREPLALATGAGSASQRAIGTAVIGGMITAVALAVLFVPAFFVFVRTVFKGRKPKPPGPNEPPSIAHGTPPAAEGAR